MRFIVIVCSVTLARVFTEKLLWVVPNRKFGSGSAKTSGEQKKQSSVISAALSTL